MDSEGLLRLFYILSGARQQRGCAWPQILQDRLPVAPWMAEHTLRLPGTVPIPPADWLQRDEAFAAQMAYRDRLIAERPAAVPRHGRRAAAPPPTSCSPSCSRTSPRPPATRATATTIRRPDGVAVPLDGPPLLVAGRLVQEDLADPREAAKAPPSTS